MQAFYVLKQIESGENDLGQTITSFTKSAVFTGYMDMLSGSESTDKLAFLEDSTHIILTKDMTVDVSKHDHIETLGKTYEVTYVDDPVNLGHHLEIYAKAVTG